MCDFATNTVNLLIENPLHGDEYYCTKGNDESLRTTVSVAGKRLIFFIFLSQMCL